MFVRLVPSVVVAMLRGRALEELRPRRRFPEPLAFQLDADAIARRKAGGRAHESEGQFIVVDLEAPPAREDAGVKSLEGAQLLAEEIRQFQARPGADAAASAHASSLSSGDDPRPRDGRGRSGDPRAAAR